MQQTQLAEVPVDNKPALAARPIPPFKSNVGGFDFVYIGTNENGRHVFEALKGKRVSFVIAQRSMGDFSVYKRINSSDGTFQESPLQICIPAIATAQQRVVELINALAQAAEQAQAETNGDARRVRDNGAPRVAYVPKLSTSKQGGLRLNGRKVEVTDLIAAGRIVAPATLVATFKGRPCTAILLANGDIECLGQTFDSLSKAAVAAAKAAGAGPKANFNGWAFWDYEQSKGKRIGIKELRDAYMAEQA